MSHSTTVNVTNVTVLQATYTALGMGALPAGTPLSQAVAGIEKTLEASLKAGWPSSFAAYNSAQVDAGIMGPWSDNVGGTAPACLVAQVTNLFGNVWELTVDPDAIKAMGGTITQEISNNGGLPGTAYGRAPLGGVTIYWGVSFMEAPIVDIPVMEFGVIYAFTAVEG